MSFVLLLGIASRNINFHHSSTFRTPASNDIDLGSGVMITNEQLKEIADNCQRLQKIKSFITRLKNSLLLDGYSKEVHLIKVRWTVLINLVITYRPMVQDFIWRKAKLHHRVLTMF